MTRNIELKGRSPAFGDSPACLHALHAFLPPSKEVDEDHGKELAHDGRRVLGIEHLAIHLQTVKH